jgi:hypothetical protein
MNVRLTPHAEELLNAMRSQSKEPAERILEHALEALAREEHVGPKATTANEAQSGGQGNDRIR